MIADFHAHLDSSWERVDQLLAAQARAGIDRTVVVSGNMLDPAFLGDYLRGRHPLRDPVPNNDFLLEAAASHPGRLLPFFTIYPTYHSPEEIDEAAHGGFFGFKLNTIVHQVDFTSPDLAELLERVDFHGAPLYLHLTLNRIAGLEAAIQLARRFTRINLVIGHMGVATADRATIDAAAIPNIHLESSIGSVLAFAEVKARDLVRKLLFGSEFPAHDPATELAKLQLVFSDHEMEMIAFGNFAELLEWREKR
jgi:uncharacterized protein